MKKIALALIACTFILTSCGENKLNNDNTQIEVSENKLDLSKETNEYKEFVEEQINMLLKDTEKFSEVLKSGNLEKAKKMYPLIRMSYERSEPIAESFGESDVNIDFRLVDFKEENNTEEGWRGFHKIEQILWIENTTKGTGKYADYLVNDIKELLAKIKTVEVTPDIMITGAVDLLNEVSTSKITGEEEIYSHTELYDFKANIEGAEKIFEIFKSKLEKVDSKLVEELNMRFKEVNSLLDKYMVDDKNYKSYTELSNEDTRLLSEAVTKLGEPLAQLGKVLDFKN